MRLWVCAAFSPFHTAVQAFGVGNLTHEQAPYMLTAYRPGGLVDVRHVATGALSTVHPVLPYLLDGTEPEGVERWWLGDITYATTKYLLDTYEFGRTSVVPPPADHESRPEFQRQYVHEVEVHDVGAYRSAVFFFFFVFFSFLLSLLSLLDACLFHVKVVGSCDSRVRARWFAPTARMLQLAGHVKGS